MCLWFGHMSPHNISDCRAQYIVPCWQGHGRVPPYSYIAPLFGSFIFPPHKMHNLVAPYWTCCRACHMYLFCDNHCCDVIMGTMASQITSLTIVYSIVHSGADQRKHQSSASLAFVRGIHRWPVNSPHKWPVTRKMFPFDDDVYNIIHK